MTMTAINQPTQMHMQPFCADFDVSIWQDGLVDKISQNVQ